MRITLLLVLLVLYVECRSLSKSTTLRKRSESAKELLKAGQDTPEKLATESAANEKTTAEGGMWSTIKRAVRGALETAKEAAATFTEWLSKLLEGSDEVKGIGTNTISNPTYDEESKNPDMGHSEQTLKQANSISETDLQVLKPAEKMPLFALQRTERDDIEQKAEPAYIPDLMVPDEHLDDEQSDELDDRQSKHFLNLQEVTRKPILKRDDPDTSILA